jgi:hypothetical protein
MSTISRSSDPITLSMPLHGVSFVKKYRCLPLLLWVLQERGPVPDSIQIEYHCLFVSLEKLYIPLFLCVLYLEIKRRIEELLGFQNASLEKWRGDRKQDKTTDKRKRRQQREKDNLLQLSRGYRLCLKGQRLQERSYELLYNVSLELQRMVWVSLSLERKESLPLLKIDIMIHRTWYWKGST